MGNELEKLNGIALSSIDKLSGLTDANMEHVNGLDFVGLVQAGSYSTSSATLSTARSRNGGFGTTRTASATVGGNNTSATKLASTEEYNSGSIASGGNLATARFALNGCGVQTAALVLGGTA